MNARLLSPWKTSLLPVVVATATVLGCKPKPTDPPDSTGGGDPTTAGNTATAEDGEVTDPGPPQEPDPPEIARGRHEVLLGHYQEGIKILEPAYMDLKDREQYRAGGLAGAWLAVAHSQIVFENAAEPAAHALAMADKTGDAEVVAAAKLARGASLLAEGDFSAAEEAFAAAATAAAADPTSPESLLALVWDGEALIGSAFGGGSTIIRPEDLDAAKKAYSKAAKTAASAGDDKDIIIGRAEEGMAAVADYQGDKATICTHAFASIDHYKAAGAAEFLVQGPSDLATKYKCKP